MVGVRLPTQYTSRPSCNSAPRTVATETEAKKAAKEIGLRTTE